MCHHWCHLLHCFHSLLEWTCCIIVLVTWYMLRSVIIICSGLDHYLLKESLRTIWLRVEVSLFNVEGTLVSWMVSQSSHRLFLCWQMTPNKNKWGCFSSPFSWMRPDYERKVFSCCSSATRYEKHVDTNDGAELVENVGVDHRCRCLHEAATSVALPIFLTSICGFVRTECTRLVRERLWTSLVPVCEETFRSSSHRRMLTDKTGSNFESIIRKIAMIWRIVSQTRKPTCLWWKIRQSFPRVPLLFVFHYYAQTSARQIRIKTSKHWSTRKKKLLHDKLCQWVRHWRWKKEEEAALLNPAGSSEWTMIQSKCESWTIEFAGKRTNLRTVRGSGRLSGTNLCVIPH